MKTPFQWKLLGQKNSKQKELDVVCGMKIDPEASRHSVRYGGTTYYFCSSGCKQHFQNMPRQFVGAV